MLLSHDLFVAYNTPELSLDEMIDIIGGGFWEKFVGVLAGVGTALLIALVLL